MDHSYRNNQGDNQGNRAGFGGRGRQQPGAPAKFFQQPEMEPLPVREDAPAKIFAFIDDLFFVAKIQETSRKLNIKVEFVKTDKDIFDKISANGDANGKPSLIIFDLNNAGAKPLATIPKLKSKLKKETAIIGFLSHVQGDLKVKALEAGCDMVLPRSAFSQNLPQLLRRHAVSHEDEALDA
jgi:PleD family two-component response regulator